MSSTALFVKRSVKSVAALGRGLRPQTANSVTILGYHRVTADLDTAEQDSIYGLVVSRETFRAHCLLLKQNFDVVSLEEAGEFLRRGIPAERPKAVITFDDGYADNYENAFPILRELNLPATIFLPTMMIGGDEPLAHDKAFWLAHLACQQNTDWRAAFLAAGVVPTETDDELALTDQIVYQAAATRDHIISELEKRLGVSTYPEGYKLLDWEQIREMSRAGIDFGDHTATHPVLPLEDSAAFEAEIVASKQFLEAQLGHEITTFAYPNGRFDARVRQAIVDAGYRVGVTTDKHINKFGEDLFALGRTCLCEESTRGLSGRYSAQVAKLRLGIGGDAGRVAFQVFFTRPLEKLLAVAATISALSFLL